MKQFHLTIIFLYFTLYSFSQAPQSIPYQSALRNSTGTILSNQSVSIRFSIRDSIITGPVVYQETHSTTTNNQGLISLNIGQGSPTTGTFSSISWGKNGKYLQVEMDLSGGSNYTDLGTQRMSSVPYALYAANGVPKGINVGDILSWNGSSWIATANTSNKPAVTTNTIISPTGTIDSAICSGSILSDGGYSITSKGICWSTQPNPTINDFHVEEGPGASPFTSVMHNLLPDTIYYYRAYATNSVGTGYGLSYAFSTMPFFTPGRLFQGGVIAYILQPGDTGYDANTFHGLIVPRNDQSTGANWGCQGTLINGADGTDLGTGNQNTLDIMNGCSTPGIAARICGDLVLNGYSDWYLPSKDELYKIGLNSLTIEGFVNTHFYWSSSETDSNSASGVLINSVSTVSANGLYKNGNLLHVRAVRSF